MESSPPGKLPSVGDVIAGKYRLEKIIGQGGMGAVYSADHELLGQKVAVKVLLAEVASNAEANARFVNEARAAFRIQSEHVVRVLDVGMYEGSPYMVMEMLDGEDLAQLLEQRGRLAPEEAVDYVVQALQAIGQAHALGIVHRDLKPSNLFLSRKSDGSAVVKVLDFGISKAGAGALGQAPGSLTSTKAMLGSPLYMSPEQLRSSKNVDARADIWALGVVLYELLTGAVPYTGDNIGELFAAILEQDAAPLRTKAPHVPEGLEQVVMACLRRKADERIASAEALAGMLAPFGTSAVAGSVRQSSPMLASAPVMPYGGGDRSQSVGTPHAMGATGGSAGALPGAATTPFGAYGAPPNPGIAVPAAVVGTGGPWSEQSGTHMPTPKSPIGLIVGGAVGALVVIAALGFVAMRAASAGDDAAAAAEPSAAPSAEPPPEVPPELTPTAEPTPPTPPEPVASDKLPVARAPKTAPPKPAHPPKAEPEPKAPDPVAKPTVEPKPEPPKPKPKPKPKSGTLQNSR